MLTNQSDPLGRLDRTEAAMLLVEHRRPSRRVARVRRARDDQTLLPAGRRLLDRRARGQVASGAGSPRRGARSRCHVTSAAAQYVSLGKTATRLAGAARASATYVRSRDAIFVKDGVLDFSQVENERCLLGFGGP